MNLDSLSYTLSQISSLVANLSRKNYNSSVQEILNAIQLQGFEADRHLLRCLLSHIDLRDSEGPRTASHKDYYQALLLAQQCKTLLNKPSLISILCFALDNPLANSKLLKPSIKFFIQLSRLLHLSPVQEVVFGIVCLESVNYSTYALEFVKKKLPELIRFYINLGNHSYQITEGGLHDSSPEVLHLILRHIFDCKDRDFGISKEVKNILLLNLRRDFPLEVAPILLTPLIYSNKPDRIMSKINQETMNIKMLDTSLADFILEYGYSFCVSKHECKENLMSIISGNDITFVFGPKSIANVLVMMIRTHTGLDSQSMVSFWMGDSRIDLNDLNANANLTTWKVEVFVGAILELNPVLSWTEVIKELDQSEFMIKDRQGLVLFFTAIRLAIKKQIYLKETFPIQLFYNQWTNSDSQMSLLQYCLQNSDVFCFNEYPCRRVNVDILNIRPGTENQDINNWRSIDLVDALFGLAERGHCYEVQECLKYPVHNCPDLLALALIQSNEPLNIIRHEIFSGIFPIFLGNHSNSDVILNRAWNHQNAGLKHTLAQTMCDWYMQSDCDHVKLSRILDIAQDLKSLSFLLSIHQFTFAIDLACLASQRDYLKLDKWLSDKFREHGEPFIASCVKFLQKRCPQLTGFLAKDENFSKYTTLSSDTVLTMLNCLRTINSGNVTPNLLEAIMMMVTNYTNLYVSKVPRINPIGPPPTLIRQPQHLRTMEASTSQLYVNQFSALPTSLTNMGLNPTLGSAFTLPASLGHLIQPSISPSRNMFGNPSGFNHLPMMTSPSTSVPCSNMWSHLNVLPNMMSCMPPLPVTTPAITKPVQTFENSMFLDNISDPMPKEIEDEANSYFQRIYSLTPSIDSLSIDGVLEMLKRFLESSDKREKDVFCCVLRNLFDEYRFFNEYPETELNITAHLFGGVIQHGLIVNFKVLCIALRFVLDSLKSPPDTKMYNFGIIALNRFKNRLKDYQQYCTHISAIPHYHQFPPHLIEYVEYGKAFQEPPPSSRLEEQTETNMTQGSVKKKEKKSVNVVVQTTTTDGLPASASLSVTSSSTLKPARPSFAIIPSVESLLDTKNKNIIIPSESVQDKIGFIFNNLSQVNVQLKCKEVREIIINDYLPWLSQYLIMRRVSLETNFHTLYLNFVDCFDNARFSSLIMEDTLKSIKVLLGCSKDLNNFSERTLLKNLGHWYGMITLGKNKPILMKDVDLKMLLVDAYSKGIQELLFTVPFITKVLESCSKSRIFKPKNPWTMAIMNCLAELHRTPNLKLTLKFEVEVLCKNLKLNLMDLQPTCILSNSELERDPDEEPTSDSEEQQVPVEEPMEINIPVIITSETQRTRIASAVQSVFLFNDDLVTQIVTAGGIRTLTSSISDISPTPMIDDKYNLSTLESAPRMSQIIAINSLVPRFVKIPKLKGCVWAAIIRTVRDWIEPIVQRTVKIAADTTIAIVKKDFSMDPDELLMRKAAHLFIEKITSPNALDRIREHVLYTLNLNLKQHFISVIASPKQAQIELIDKASTICANDHLGLTCSFIHQNVSRKAKLEIDDTLKTEYEKSKMEFLRYAAQNVASNQAAQFLPALLPNKVNLPTPQMLDLYDEYSKTIPGFQSLDQSAIALFIAKNSNPPDEMAIIYEKLISDVESLLQLYLANQRILSNSTQPTNLHSVLEALISLRRSRDVVNGANVVNKVLECFLDGLNPSANRDLDMTIRYRDTLLNIFRAFQDPRVYNIQWTNKTLTKALIGARDDLRYNLDAIDGLIRAGLVNMTMYDMHLAMSMDNGTNYVAMAYVKQFLKYYLVDNRTNSPINEQHLQSSIEAISSILHSGLTAPDGLASIIEVIRPPPVENDSIDRLTNNNNVSTLNIQHGMLQGRDIDDPPGLLEKTEYLLKEWLALYNSSSNRDPAKTFNVYIHQMNVQGILKSDDIITRFFRLSSQMIVELCYRQLPDSTLSPTTGRTKLSNTIDAYVKLIVMLVKHSGDTNATTIKTNLLNKVLGIIVGVLLQDHQLQGSNFYQLPYHRMLIMLFLDLNTPDPVLESINSATLAAYCHTYHLLRPKKVPGFAFAWIELISNRVFIGRILEQTPQEKGHTNDQKQNTDVQGWNFYAQLLVDLLKYLAPFLRNAELAKPVHLLYKGALRIMLILLHDFPEFLCEYHYGFCDAVPPNCVQMRNLILSAFPRNMRLPDPFTPNLKVDVLKEIAISPKIGQDFQCNIQPQTFKKNLDLYLKTRSPVTFLTDIRSTLQQTSVEPGMRYNLTLLNAIVLYVGTQAIQHIKSKGQVPNTSTIAHSAHMDIFQTLSVDLDTEGRYLFLNSMANHLRYPNSHTHYFSCTLLLLFAEANSEAIQEQITRVLLERLIVNRPHPWGLLITFIELIKNPLYKFWDHEFVHCAPEIEKLFESVARSCMVHKQKSQPPTFASMSRMSKM